MIYTLTLNPALDYILSVPVCEAGGVNRARGETILAGGKGINVSAVLNNIGVENTALGFTAGFTGNEITRLLSLSGCKTDFIRLEDGFSRINIKIKSHTETEINGQGPDIPQSALDLLKLKLSSFDDNDTLVLSGSVPPSLSNSIYCDIMEYLSEKKLNIIVDAEGSLLINTLKYRPFLVKPNHHELGAIFGAEINTRSEAVPYAKKLLEMGARSALVSMAEEGAVFVSGDGTVLQCAAPDGKLINSTGAGDSMLAGFIAGYMENQSFEHAFKMGLAAGSASAFSQNLPAKEEILKLYNTFE